MMAPKTALQEQQLRQHYEIEKELADRLRQASKEERRRLYNIVYDERIRRIPHHPLRVQANDPVARRRAAAPQIRLLRPFLRPERGDTVFLEIGPGDGTVGLEIAQDVSRVYAVDVSAALMQDLQPPDNFEFRLVQSVEIPVPENSVHVAYSNQVMEHLHPEDALDQVRNIHTALVPGGIFLCITPNRLSGPWDVSRNFDREATCLHLKEYTLGELGDLFLQAGFRRVFAIVSFNGRRFPVRLPIRLVAFLERWLERIPYVLRRRTGPLLAAFKVIAQK